MTKKKTHEEFVQEVYELEQDNYVVVGTYVDSKTKIEIFHKECSQSWFVAPAKFLIGRRCGNCKGKTISKAKTTTLTNFIKNLKHKRPDLIYIEGYKNQSSKIKVKSIICGHEWGAIAGNITNAKSGCPECHGIKDTDTFKRELEEKYPNEYELLSEYVNNRTKVKVKHLSCGHSWDSIPKDLLRQFRCPNCNKSLGEKLVRDFLNELKIKHSEQHSFEGCYYKAPLKFDFIVFKEDKFFLIEVDGSQHFDGYDGFYSSEEIKIRDEIKNKYCEEKNIVLLRIPYWNFRNSQYKNKIIKSFNEL